MPELPERMVSSGNGMIMPPRELICSSCEDWGVDRRWFEPWDEQTAQQTISTLVRSYPGGLGAFEVLLYADCVWWS